MLHQVSRVPGIASYSRRIDDQFRQPRSTDPARTCPEFVSCRCHRLQLLLMLPLHGLGRPALMMAGQLRAAENEGVAISRRAKACALLAGCFLLASDRPPRRKTPARRPPSGAIFFPVDHPSTLSGARRARRCLALALMCSLARAPVVLLGHWPCGPGTGGKGGRVVT
jgi:hypothetical protein